MTLLGVIADQQSRTVSAEGAIRNISGLKTGELLTADWIMGLLAEGRLFQMSVGTVAAGGNITLITGGGNGTTIDQDQPEFGVSVPNGTILVPIQIDIATQPDLDADAEEANIIVTVDTAAAYAGDGTVTSETPTNLLTGGGQTSVATAFSAATADITDPTVSEILAFESIQASEFISNGSATNLTNGLAAGLSLHWSARQQVPIFIQGPGAFYGYWGGTAAVPGIARVVWAEIPEGRFTF